MTQVQRIEPAPGFTVFDPVTKKPLRAIGLDGKRGEEKEIDSYWHRRLADRDVLIVEPEQPVAVKPKSKKSAEGK